MNAVGLRLARITAVICLILLFQGIAYSQAKNRISGQIFGHNRQPVSDVYVELINEINAVLFRIRTDGSGRYYFSGMGPGRYSIRARPFGTDYDEQIQEVELVTAVGGRNSAESLQKDIYLSPRRAANKQPGATGVVFAQEIPPEAKLAFERALVELDATRVDAGILELENATKIFPDYYYALDRLGTELLKKHRYAEAGKVFERAVAINARSSNSWYGLSFSLYAQDLITGSIDAAKKAAALASESADINIMLGIALRKGKMYADAEKALLKAKKLAKGQSADASWNLALLYAYNLNNKKLAADELENYLKVKPDHPDAQKLRQLIGQYRSGS